MNPELVVFVVFAIVSLAGALMMVIARSPVYSAMGLLMAMFSMAVLYVLNGAHFVAAIQVFIYAGAVMTLFLFVIMLIGVDRADDTTEQIPYHRLIISISSAGLFVALVLAGWAGKEAWVTGVSSGTPDGSLGTIENVSEQLFSIWLLPLEATVLLLTIAAVGTIALAQFRDSQREPSVSTLESLVDGGGE